MRLTRARASVFSSRITGETAFVRQWTSWMCLSLSKFLCLRVSVSTRFGEQRHNKVGSRLLGTTVLPEVELGRAGRFNRCLVCCCLDVPIMCRHVSV